MLSEDKNKHKKEQQQIRALGFHGYKFFTMAECQTARYAPSCLWLHG